jgi:hypothetical protein
MNGTDSPTTTQSVRTMHSLSGTLSFRYASATSQTRLHGVLGRTSMYEIFFVYSLDPVRIFEE